MDVEAAETPAVRIGPAAAGRREERALRPYLGNSRKSWRFFRRKNRSGNGSGARWGVCTSCSSTRSWRRTSGVQNSRGPDRRARMASENSLMALLLNKCIVARKNCGTLEILAEHPRMSHRDHPDSRAGVSWPLWSFWARPCHRQPDASAAAAD